MDTIVLQRGEIKCLQLTVRGTVQGVGFRPFVFNLARDCTLKGWVKNFNEGVLIEVEGEPGKLAEFSRRLMASPPKLARIENMDKKTVPARGYSDFQIKSSRPHSEKTACVPPDAASCHQCLEEVMNPSDRHYLYPFTNCTHCGPRFTIVGEIPYDRVNTTMRNFRICPRCESEYKDVSDRRFHAQPIACPGCGPSLTILDGCGQTVAGSRHWLDFFWEKMKKGSIFAVKGIGGFHLACITGRDAVKLLRTRKGRPWKPFAIMCRNMETIKHYCEVNAEEENWLCSPAAPVVLLRAKNANHLPEEVNPGMSTLGVMLPYTPLHHLLMQGSFDIMVLTSANPTDMPILKDNDEALDNLKYIADFFLIHDRDINQRCDDSVVAIGGRGVQFHRRSRGFVPTPVKTGFRSGEVVLGAGSEMKNTFCILKGGQAFLSQHLGEMYSLEAGEFYRESLAHFMKIHDLHPRVIGYDLHPGYNISDVARTLPAKKRYAVQHHHAHFTSCLAENGFGEDAVGVILDGTGYGTDGAVWGFEILKGNCLHFEREYHQAYVPLPGGEFSVKNPWAMAVSYLYLSMGNRGLEEGEALFGPRFGGRLQILMAEVKARLNSIPTSSCGRLFDAVSALAGVCYENTYEGQAAIQLGELLEKQDLSLPADPYPFHMDNHEIDFSPVFPTVLEELKKNRDRRVIARRFHDTVIKAVTGAVLSVSDKCGLKAVALSGGTWHNRYLLEKTANILLKNNLRLLLHRQVTPGDGGLSLGQAAVAYRRCRENVPGDTHESS